MTQPAADSRHTVDSITSDALDALYAELDALKTIATGYCGHCGRGDCSPTAEQWYEQRRRADKAEAALDAVRKTLRAINLEVGTHRGISDPETLGYRLGLAGAERELRAALDAHQPTT